MKEFIKNQEKECKKVVDARELYIPKESKRHFGYCIQSHIEKHNFIDGLNFISLNKNVI